MMTTPTGGDKDWLIEVQNIDTGEKIPMSDYGFVTMNLIKSCGALLAQYETDSVSHPVTVVDDELSFATYRQDVTLLHKREQLTMEIFLYLNRAGYKDGIYLTSYRFKMPLIEKFITIDG